MRFTFYARGEVETCSSVLDVSIRTTVKPSIHALEILPCNRESVMNSSGRSVAAPVLTQVQFWRIRLVMALAR
jgi:hypothetical protein